MRPWRVSVGLTMSATALAIVFAWKELEELRPHWRVIVKAYWPWLAGYAGVAAGLSLAVFYTAARVLGLGDLGRKVDVIERTIRRGEGRDPELTAALQRDDEGTYPE